MKDFVNLRVHSSYSIKDGLLSPKQIVDIAAKNGEKAVAITDLNYMLKAVEFYEYARKKGVKPIIGVDAYIERDIFNPEEFDELENFTPTRMILLAKNSDGYKKINEISSRAILENQKDGFKGYEGVGFIKQSWFKEYDMSNIIVLSGETTSSDLVQEALYGDKKVALEKALFYKEHIGDNFFLEIQRFDQKDEYESIVETLNISSEIGIPVTVTHPIQFEKRTDFYNHEVRSCIVSKELVHGINHIVKFNREQYYKTKSEINELFEDLSFAIENSSKIADMCNAKLKLNISELPQFTKEAGGETDYLIEQSKKGLENRLLELYPNEEERKINKSKYKDRLDFELGVINQMGFPGYFLIVQDFIAWAKNQDIMVGPGRGSGAGSLVAYSLGITDLDPLKYNLLFERFLNPERVSMPDFDNDYDAIKRSKVIEYTHSRYDKPGEGLSVSQIATYGLLKPKAVLKSVGRVLGMPYSLTDQISKKIPNDPNLKLEDVLNQEWMITLRKDSSEVNSLMTTCEALYLIPTSVGVHAGGVVIGKTQLTDYSPLARSDSSGPIFTQYDKNEVEITGLVKFDFLGLSNLSVLSMAIDSINQREEFLNNKKFDLRKIDLTDKNVLNLFKVANTVAVFQFEGQGMRNTLKLISPDKFEDLIAIVSLFRPGPMEFIPDYARNKASGVFDSPHPLLDDMLKETYGIMVYQEQVMQAAQIIAGYSLGQADLLRRAMGKKKVSEMEAQRAFFIEGAAKNGINAEKATEIFYAIEKFAGYGFNKSHAAAYSLISYQTAFLKHYYTTEYFAAFLNVESMEKSSKNTAKVELLLSDARENGLTILPPDINTCDPKFTYHDKSIRYGLSGIKGVTPSSINMIKEDLNINGSYTSFINFYERVGIKIKKNVLENLIFAGVFDNLEENRSKLFNIVPDLLEYRKVHNKNIENLIVNAERQISNKPIEKTNLRIDEINLILKNIKNMSDFEIQKLVEEVNLLSPETDCSDPLKLKKVKKLRVQKDLNIKDNPLPDIDKHGDSSWSEVTKFNYEKSVYGFYLTGHPYRFYKKDMNGFKATFPFEDIQLIDVPKEGEVKLISGVIHNITKKKTKTGNPMWIIEMGDSKNTISIFAFDFIIEKHEENLKVGNMISIQAKIKSSNDKNLVSIEDIFPYEDIKFKLTKGINVALKSERNSELIEMIEKHSGGMGVTIYNPETNSDNYSVMDLDQKIFGVNVTAECIKDFEDKFGKNNVLLKYHEKMLFSNNYKYKFKQ